MGVSFDDLLGALYEIQGLSDPNHDVVSTSPTVRARNGAERKARTARIFDIACDMMERSGYQPPEPYGLTHLASVGPNFCVMCQSNNCTCSQ